MERPIVVDQVARPLLAIMITWALYHVAKALYNISPFHPLNAIPGPKLAAATYLPEFWHDAVCFGRYTTEIRKMHQIYGMATEMGLVVFPGQIVEIYRRSPCPYKSERGPL